MRVFILPNWATIFTKPLYAIVVIFHSTNMFGCSGPVLLTLPIFTATISDTLNLDVFSLVFF